MWISAGLLKFVTYANVTMTGVTETKVPPDGGYGWVVVFSYALNNVSILYLSMFFLYFSLFLIPDVSSLFVNFPNNLVSTYATDLDADF